MYFSLYLIINYVYRKKNIRKASLAVSKVCFGLLS